MALSPFIRVRPTTNIPLLRNFLIVSAVSLFIGATFALPAHAAEISVVASALDNPRGLDFSQTGALYVAEAGRGGSGPCVPNPEGGTRCYGATGAITRIWQSKQERIATGLPSLAGPDGSAATGPHDVAAIAPGMTFVTTGLGGSPSTREALGPTGQQFGRVLRVLPNGNTLDVADLVGYEATANPDHGEVDSNPYGVLALPQEQFITDAGGNSLVKIGPAGRMSTVAVFPDRNVAPPFPGAPDPFPMQAVPTTVARGPDGALYVGQLTGFPFPAGGARVYRVVEGQPPSTFAEGFTNIIDMAFAPDGTLYVLEITGNGLLSSDPTGALVKVGRDGSKSTMLTHPLVMPGGLTVGPDGALYVTNNSTSAGSGEVLRIRL
jgi:hypothetical protein